jgi:hypothetical protein
MMNGHANNWIRRNRRLWSPVVTARRLLGDKRSYSSEGIFCDVKWAMRRPSFLKPNPTVFWQTGGIKALIFTTQKPDGFTGFSR